LGKFPTTSVRRLISPGPRSRLLTTLSEIIATAPFPPDVPWNMINSMDNDDAGAQFNNDVFGPD
jgi:hypothetical protein